MMTTEQVVEVLVKITGLPPGLFEETESRVRSNLTSKVFNCEAEGDEYTVLINAKDEIIEIKNS